MNALRVIAVFLILSISAGMESHAQISIEKDSLSVHYAQLWDIKRIRKHLSVLCADSLEGRETAKRGQRLAAAYIREQLINTGLKAGVNDTGYVQQFPLLEIEQQEAWVRMGKDTLRNFEDFYSFSFLLDTLISFDEVKFLGYGIMDENYDNYGTQDVRGKAILIANGEPMDGKNYRLSNSILPTLWSDGYDAKIELARSKGASVLFIVQDYFDLHLPKVTNYLQKPKVKLRIPNSDVLPVVFIPPSRVDEFFGEGSYELLQAELAEGKEQFSLRKNEEMSFRMKKSVKRLWSHNLMAHIPGSVNPDEHVILTAHYDHLGRRGEDIFYGADDNGSGTSALMEIARCMQQAFDDGIRFNRSISFLFFSGEEKGLLGSDFYTQYPMVKLENTVANLNVDMIGRRDASRPGGLNDYIYLIGSDRLSKELHELSEAVNETYVGLELDYKFNDESDPQRLYYRSDHFNFAKHRIPVIFYFKGLHEDYHKGGDRPEKIQHGSLQQAGRLIFHTAWTIANLDRRIEVDEEIK